MDGQRGFLKSAVAAAAVVFVAAVATGCAGKGFLGMTGGMTGKGIPDLTGEWSGTNRTISDLKGLREWKKTVYITEQKDRRFRGHFEYSEGRKDFFGVIHPGNRRFTWVANDSKGYTVGRVHRGGKISACYVESWEEATAGCAILTRQ